LKPIKTALDKSFDDALTQSITDLPVCPSDTVSNNENTDCRPKNMTSQELLQEIEKSNPNKISKNIPDSYDLSTLTTTDGSGPWGSARQAVEYFSLTLYILTALCIFNLGLVALLIFKPVYSLLRWLATALIIPGVLLLSVVFGNILLATFLKTSNWNLPADVSSLINNSLSSLFSSTLVISIIINTILLILPIGLYILASVLEKRSKIATK